ncbi:type II toxin-antitoxin system VapB family antitoxin [Streptomyces yangpuensis]|uniref:type II toxin-antitoxin system VapB family antitoxin n=1 Tax=Streptomyces yangpuensis TaxID=1648182 RepID=UPI0038001379
MPEREQRTGRLSRRTAYEVIRTMVDLDDALLAEAAEILGTATKRATINGALAELVAAARRRRFADLVDEGVFDDLRDPDVMRGAWR